MLKLEQKDYGKVMELVKGLEENCTFAYGVVCNGLPGRVFVDEVNDPKSCMVTCAGGKYMVAGIESNEEFNAQLVEFLKDEKNHKIYYDFYATSEKWIELLRKGLEGHSIPLPRTIYRYESNTAPEFLKLQEKLEQGYELKRMDEKLFQEMCEKIDITMQDQWGSAEAFVTKGLGYCILHNGEIASICYAVVAGGGYAELSIITMKQHRGKNLALITCSAFIEECIKRDMTAIWDAGSDNKPSNQLALKLGFQKAKDVNLVFWHENREVIQKYLDKKIYM